ncbi:hypothetical protein M758_1G145000 [Ceratodon purpureus]|uniref:Uncharacterized protein n=1 Tax=Ceratodon purpureus TaxID=3225 RepID=A0A8T0J5B6_CERPU|nr:hypothetical protein KC19_1G148300 [Ceratodon purpureus]KAG0629986.1 hypothetical protein M758_1G145000 [Ceratodon purpureus]
MAHGRPTLDGDTELEKVAISGAALAALMQAVNSSAGDCDGVLFGHVERNTTSTMVDEDVGSRTSHNSTAVVTGHFCSGRVTSFYDATGHIDVAKFAQMVGEREARGGDPPIGWFVGRRGTVMRPSMREYTVTANLRGTQFSAPEDAAVGSEDVRDGKVKDSRTLNSANGLLGEGNGLSSKEVLAGRKNPSQEGALSKLIGIPSSSPCIFFLFTESSDANSVHTHEYRAFQYRTKLPGAGFFETRAVKIVNIGQAFRGLYDFAPVAPFPWFTKSSGFDGESSDEGLRRLSMTPHHADVQMDVPQEADQALLDMYSQDFSVDRLQSLIRTEGEGGSVRELEALYRTMLRKLDVLAKQVCEGNGVIFEQELANSKLKMALQSAGKR